MKKTYFVLFVVPIIIGCLGVLVSCGKLEHKRGTATPTPTSPPSVLGSSLNAFESRLGDALHDTDLYGNTIPDSYIISTGFAGTGAVYRLQVTDGFVASIDIQNLHNTKEDRQLCYSFLPHDAKLVQRGYEDGVNDVYISRQLSAEFPSSLFLNNNQPPDTPPTAAPPGTFSISFVPAAINDRAYCDLRLGE